MKNPLYFSLVLISIFLTYSCSKECNHDAEERLSNWKANQPDHYSFEYRISCFCSAEEIGPYHVEIINSEIDTAYYLGIPEIISPQLKDYMYVKEIVKFRTIDVMFDQVIDRDFSNRESKCELTYNNQYGYLESYKLIAPDYISDGGFSWEIDNFQNLE